MADTHSTHSVTQLVITDGSLPGLVASMIASEETVRRESLGAGRPMLWIAAAHGAASVEHQAKTLGLRTMHRAPTQAAGVRPAADGIVADQLLLDAGRSALELAAPVIVWPVVPAGPASAEPGAIELIAEAVNRAALLSRLISLDAPSAGLPEIRFDLPFVDLTDAQIADLACDLGVRFEDCWWWSVDSSEASAERARWGPLLPVAV